MKSLFEGSFPQLIMFDLDGTLVDSVPDLASAIDKTLQSLGLPVVGETNVRLWVGNGASMLVERALKHVSPVIDSSLSGRAYARFLNNYADCLADKSQLYGGVLDALEKLYAREIPMAIVTNKPIAFTHPLLTGLEIAHFFPTVLGGDSLPAKKPDPLPLNTLIEQYGIRPDQALMVGDSVNDILAARAAGCPVIAVPYGYNHGQSIYEAGADKVICDLGELLE
ncbi:phosphoglycolate phosphatase [Neptunomonas antarctica]|uniref:Phosphoglycolate phosphatase n=1 Tax=Neptunomonas antarctica TaxID=619304 RepID=A0A1N7JDX0_9GAMM|nr:phosphoglycolate phosphatase [Neptunomonas antarctica]SIS47537.1 phosphoglycolate phosphatase [Neptunomonas antarctica]